MWCPYSKHFKSLHSLLQYKTVAFCIPPFEVPAQFSSLSFVTTHLALYFPETWKINFSSLILLLLTRGTSLLVSIPFISSTVSSNLWQFHHSHKDTGCLVTYAPTAYPTPLFWKLFIGLLSNSKLYHSFPSLLWGYAPHQLVGGWGGGVNAIHCKQVSRQGPWLFACLPLCWTMVS